MVCCLAVQHYFLIVFGCQIKPDWVSLITDQSLSGDYQSTTVYVHFHFYQLLIFSRFLSMHIQNGFQKLLIFFNNSMFYLVINLILSELKNTFKCGKWKCQGYLVSLLSACFIFHVPGVCTWIHMGTRLTCESSRWCLALHTRI